MNDLALIEKQSSMSPEEQLDGIIGRLIQANGAVQKNLISEMKQLMMSVKNRREYREDARAVLFSYQSGDVGVEQALDLLGFGEPVDPYGPRAVNAK